MSMMSMMPHWLDEVFSAGNGDIEATIKALTEHERFKAAMDAGTYGYRNAQRDQKEHGERPGSDPSQYARSQFLENASLKPLPPDEV